MAELRAAGAAGLGRWLRARAENVSVLLLSVMFVCFIVQIAFRYFLNRPVGWTEEVTILCWIWAILWGASFVMSERDEVRFDIIYGNVTGRWRRGFTIVTGLALIALYGGSLPAAWSYVSFMHVERTAYLRIPLVYPYSIYLIFAVACICRYAWLVRSAIRGDAAPETDPARLVD